jgi:hypothetical protein
LPFVDPLGPGLRVEVFVCVGREAKLLGAGVRTHYAPDDEHAGIREQRVIVNETLLRRVPNL